MAFKLDPNPTFKTAVSIPVPGEVAEKVLFTFKHKTDDEIGKYQQALSSGEKTLKDVAKEVVENWIHPGIEFNAENLDLCLNCYPGSPLAIWIAFRDALYVAKEKN